jgi:hypothetical protein
MPFGAPLVRAKPIAETHLIRLGQALVVEGAALDEVEQYPLRGKARPDEVKCGKSHHAPEGGVGAVPERPGRPHVGRPARARPYQHQAAESLGLLDSVGEGNQPSHAVAHRVYRAGDFAHLEHFVGAFVQLTIHTSV